jgi:hypothetical protein
MNTDELFRLRLQVCALTLTLLTATKSLNKTLERDCFKSRLVNLPVRCYGWIATSRLTKPYR